MNLIVCRVTSARCARSRRLQDDIAVRRRVAGADQPDGLGHALPEIDVGLAGQRDFTEGFREAGHGFLGVGAHELVRLPDPADLENGCQQVQHVQHRGNPPRQRKIDRLDFRPIGKRPVRDHQRVGVADSG